MQELISVIKILLIFTNDHKWYHDNTELLPKTFQSEYSKPQ